VLHVAGCWRHGNMHQSRYRSAQTLSAQIPLYPPLRKGEKIGPEGLIASLIPGAARILWPSPPAPLPRPLSPGPSPQEGEGRKTGRACWAVSNKSSAKTGIIPPFVKGGEGGFLQSTRRGSALAVLHVAGCWRHGNMHQSRYRSAQTLSAQIPLYPPLRKGEKIGPEGLIASLIPGAARILWPSPPAPCMLKLL